MQGLAFSHVFLTIAPPSRGLIPALRHSVRIRCLLPPIAGIDTFAGHRVKPVYIYCPPLRGLIDYADTQDATVTLLPPIAGIDMLTSLNQEFRNPIAPHCGD